MFKKCLAILLILAGMTSCARKQSEQTSFDSATAKRQETKYLAYEHSIEVDVKEENISDAFKATIDACSIDKDNNCTVLDSKNSSGAYPSASVRLRIKPEGVKNIVEVAASKGKLVQQSTHVEDLAKPLLDNAQRLKMLESHRDNLVALQHKAKDDIDALIKVSSELTRVLSEIEQAKGQDSFLSQRINMDIVCVEYLVQQSRSFWKPISSSLSNFSNNLSDGISCTIVVFAYLLPGAVFFIVAFTGIRFLRRRRQNR